MPKPDQSRAPRVILMQALMTVATGGAAILLDDAAALSAAVGAGTGALANTFFALWIFRRYWAQAPGALVLRFYWAEIAKIAITLTLFATAYWMIEGLQPAVLLGAYFIVQIFPPLLACHTHTSRIREG